MKSNNRPKVGIFTKPIDQGTSGSGSYLRQLVNNILNINDRFHIVLIHYSKNNNEIYKKADQLIISKNPLLATIKLIKEKFDILHFYPITIFSPIWLRKPKKITSIHGGGAAQFYFPYQYSKIKVLHSRIIKPFYIRKMDYIFVGSKAGKFFITNQYHVKKDKIFFTHSSVDKDFKKYKDNPIKAKKKFGIDKPFIFHLSKYSVRKNPWTMLNAFQILKEKKFDLKFVLGGKGWKNQKVVEFVKKKNILKDIIFTGFISREEIIELLNLAEVFVFPSFFEGFGIPNIEAMACGCPVITSNAFAIPEVVGDAALILNDNRDPSELANKIIQIINDTNLRNNLINKGFERVKKFSWKKSAQTVLDTYEKCLQ
ncbi:MAG: glycosyl transferase family 1 [Promethearchaeota archaeon Loki_b32]|nr:MAG: glycosyl transferase family 1 [Candidatus Lokiarchaeota archaeon Loki_b32]